MRTADDYRARAAEVERMAGQMSRADHRAELLALARSWREIAAHMDPPPPPEATGEAEAAA